MTGIIIVKGIEKFSESAEPAAATGAPDASPSVPYSGEPWQVSIGAGRIVSSEIEGGILLLLIEDEDGKRRVELRDAVTGGIRGQATTE